MVDVALLKNAGDRLWRTDMGIGRSIYALLSNDETKSSTADPLVGVMETSELAENVVDLHNAAIKKFGRHYRRVMEIPDA